MKRKLQAQRKFAQSVALPAAGQPAAELAPAPSTPARQGRTINLKLSASALLDQLANHGIHDHNPVVVIEHLFSKKSDSIIRKCKAVVKPNIRRLIKLKSAKKKPNPVKPTKQTKVAEKRHVRSKTTSSEPMLSSDDEKPLLYFVTKTTEPEFKEPAVPALVPERNVPISVEQPETSARRLNDVDMMVDVPNAEIDNQSDAYSMKLRYSESNEPPDNIPDEIPDVSADVSADVIPDVSADVSADVIPDVSADVIPDETPNEIPAVSPNETLEVMPPVTTNEKDLMVEAPGGAYYGDSRIKAWIDSSPSDNTVSGTVQREWSPSVLQPLAEDLATPGPSGAAPYSHHTPPASRRLTRRKSRASSPFDFTDFVKPATRNSRSRSMKRTLPSPPPLPPVAQPKLAAPAAEPDDDASSRCPSRAFSTVGSMMHAPISEMQCRKCGDCTRYETVRQQISRSCMRLVQSSEPIKEDDVYNFSCDDAPPQGAYQPRKERPPPPPSIASSLNGEYKTYLNILESSPQIIELTSFRVPQSKNYMMKARLIPRSEAKTNNMCMVQHEILLEELLRMSAPVSGSGDGDANKPRAEPAKSASPQCKRKGKTLQKGPTPVKGRKKSCPAPAEMEIHARIPSPPEGAKLVDAPSFHPTDKEFSDPIAYIEKIAPKAAKFGIIKIVAPKSFKPVCNIDENVSFSTSGQYIARMYSRWGPCAREMAAIKACLSTQGVKFKTPPLMAGIELSLPKLYSVVQKNGGLNEVNDKKKWSAVAEEMGLTTLPNPEKKLDTNYVKYLVPYETLSNVERLQICAAVEKAWLERNRKLQECAFNPLHRQKKLLGEESSSDSEVEEDDVAVARALEGTDDCVVKGRKMNLTVFKNVAQAAEAAFLRNKGKMSVSDIENEYWRIVLLGTDHVCVNAASIDTGDHGYGFSKAHTPCAKHPWNLKMFSANSGNVLRSLGSVLGVTVPQLHLGMAFSTSCWHRDPHGLPWIEYMHQGSPKIWYGIPNEQSANFRNAVVSLCPTSSQNKAIWLPSDITMIPPNLLREHNVSLSRLVQNPGEYVVVFPKAYSCSISTGFAMSESVYFATNSWLNTIHQVFTELRESCEPTTFSLEQLLMAIAKDPRAPLSVLPLTYAGLSTVVREEQRNRRELRALQLTCVREQPRKRQGGEWNFQECDLCRATLYLSKVNGMTGRQKAVCLSHALQMIHAKRAPAERSQLQLVEFYPDTELDQILEVVQKKLT